MSPQPSAPIYIAVVELVYFYVVEYDLRARSDVSSSAAQTQQVPRL